MRFITVRYDHQNNPLIDCLERALVPPAVGAQGRSLNRSRFITRSSLVGLEFPLGSAVPSVVTVIRDLYRVTQPVSNRKNLSAQLGVVNEVFIKLSERVGGALLIRRT